MKHEIRIPAAGCILSAELRMSERPAGVVVLVHGSGTSRHDSLNRFVAASLIASTWSASRPCASLAAALRRREPQARLGARQASVVARLAHRGLEFFQVLQAGDGGDRCEQLGAA
jgi:predicted alpha/beta-hydrolase family hydrolase